MLHNMNKVCKQQETQGIEKEPTALEGHTTEIIEMVLEKQQEIQEEGEETARKKPRGDEPGRRAKQTANSTSGQEEKRENGGKDKRKISEKKTENAK